MAITIAQTGQAGAASLGVSRGPVALASRDTGGLAGERLEAGHEEMAGLNHAGLGYAHAITRALWHRKPFRIDLNGQYGPRYDQDLRFGAGSARGAFWVAGAPEGGGYDGPFPAPRTGTPGPLPQDQVAAYTRGGRRPAPTPRCGRQSPRRGWMRLQCRSSPRGRPGATSPA